MAVSLSAAVTAASVGKASCRSERSNRNRKVGGGGDDSGGGGRSTGKIAPRTYRHHRRASHAVTTKAKRTWITPAGTGRHLGGRGESARPGGGGGGAAAAVPFDRDRNLFANLLPPMASDNANMLTLGMLGGGLAMSPGAAAELRYERRQRMEEEEEQQQSLNGASSRGWATDSACSSVGSNERLHQGQHSGLSGSAAQSTTSSYSASQSGWADSERSFGGSERDSSVNGSMSATDSMCSETEQSDHE
jgi:hypothetical protein